MLQAVPRTALQNMFMNRENRVLEEDPESQRAEEIRARREQEAEKEAKTFESLLASHLSEPTQEEQMEALLNSVFSRLLK